jgi:hypothetical protein
MTLTESLDATNETLLVPRMANFLVHEQSSIMSVSMPRLVHSMISLLYSNNRSKTTQRTLGWSLSSHELPNVVYNLVRVHDCFMHTLSGPKILFDISHSYENGILIAFAEIHWQPPKITFSDLPTRLLNGELYRVTPRFAGPGFNGDNNGYNDSGFRSFKDEITFIVTKSPLAFI